MKPLLNKTLLALVLASSAAFADNGLDTRIVNDDGTLRTGDININYNMDGTVGPENQRGGIERTENGDTNLSGNITITGGADYSSMTDEERRNHGIYLSEDVTGGTVTLKTISSTDAININVYGAASTGLRNQSSGAKVVIDASSSDHAIEIHAHNSTTDDTAMGGGAIYSSGVTEIIGKEVNLSSAAKGSSGAFAYVGGKIGINTQTLNVTTSGDTADGIKGGSGLISVNAGTVNVSTSGDLGVGISANTGKVTVKADSVNIATTNNAGGIAVSANNGSVEIDAAKTTINATREGIIIYSSGGTGSNVTVNGDIEIQSGTGFGGITSQAGGTVTLTGGNALIQSGGSGVSVANNSSVNLSGGSTVIRAEGLGLYTTGGTITASSTLDVSAASHGAEASNGGSILLAGVSAMSSKQGIALRANGGTISSLGGSPHTYNMSGNMLAHTGGTIDLDMSSGSRIRGATLFENIDGAASTGIINLNIQGDSLWQVTGNSQLTSLTLGQGSALQLAFAGASLTDIISAAGAITLEAGSYIYLTGDLSGLEGSSFDFFSGTLVNNGVKFIGFDGTDWVEYDYTQTGANTFAFSASAPLVIEEPGFIPEPATATLGLLGLASLLVRRRRA